LSCFFFLGDFLGMDDPFPFDLDLPDMHYRYIGLLASISSYNDYQLDHAISILQGIDIRRSRLVTAKLQNVRAKSEAVAALIELRGLPEKCVHHWKWVDKKITTAATVRADVMHGIWNRDEDGKLRVVRYKREGKATGKPIPMEFDDLHLAAKKQAQLAAGLRGWIDLWSGHPALREQPPASPGMTE
jgi:hypothetical protein